MENIQHICPGHYEDLCENSNDLMQSVTPDGYFRYVNKAWLETLGYDKEEIKDLNIFDVIHPDEHEHCRESFAEVMSGQDIGLVTTTFITKTGRTIFVEGSVNCRLVDGKPVYTRAIFRDITEREKREEERERLIEQLTEAFFTVRTLHGLLPMCAWCKKIRDDKGYWDSVEQYIETHSDVELTHGICPECRAKYFPDTK